jgi:hypothetical protein
LLPGPYGKAEIVADEQVDLPPVDGSDKSSMAGRIMLVLPRIGEPMPFVIGPILAIGQHPDQPVIIMSFLFDNQAPREDDFFPGGHLFHPGDGGPVHGLCKGGGSHAKAGAEHLGQDDQLGLFLYALNKGF